jgi:hypothetical protein
MSYADHPLIAEAKSLVLDGDQTFSKDQIVTRFSRLNPTERVQYLRGSRIVLADEGVTLRRRAQILSLNRDLESMHRRLLASQR